MEKLYCKQRAYGEWQGESLPPKVDGTRYRGPNLRSAGGAIEQEQKFFTAVQVPFANYANDHGDTKILYKKVPFVDSKICRISSARIASETETGF